MNEIRLASIIRPPPRLRISQWAEQFAFVPFKPEEGRYHCDRMPWQRDMLDDPLDASAQEICWMIGRRLGKSICICIISEYFIQHVPSSILVKYPTLDAGKKWLRGQLLKMTTATPVMQGLLKDTRKRDSDSTMLDRHFPGGDLTVVGANSPAGLRGLNKRIVLQEEIDADEISSEGDAVSLADGRAENFYNAIKLKTSTPSVKGASRIEEIFERSDQRRFFVPCAHCGHHFVIERESMRFSFATHLPRRDGRPRGKGEIRDTPNAVLVCPACEWELQDHERIAMIRDSTAQWRATKPYNGVLGRQLSGMYRIIGKKGAFRNYLHEFAESWLEHKHGGRETLRVFINNFDARTFADDERQPDWTRVANRAEEYGPRLPGQIALLTAAVDIQRDRVEIEVLGWGDQEETWGICKYVIGGNFETLNVQEALIDFLSQTWIHETGAKIGIYATGFDTGHKTESAYQFLKKNRGRNFLALKGGASTPGQMLVTSHWLKHQGLWLHLVADDTGKDTVYSRLEITEPGPRYQHFPQPDARFETGDGGMLEGRYTRSYFEQLCSEKLKTWLERGKVRREWVKVAIRNESLDLRKYNLAVFSLLPVGLVRRLRLRLEKASSGPEPEKIDMEPAHTPQPESNPIQPAGLSVKPIKRRWL